MKNTVIHNFSGLTQPQLSQLRSALSLELTDEMLSYCMNHYRAVERRDPFTDELQALSALSTELSDLPNAACIQELFTENATLAQTYADAMKKRSVNAPGATAPPTLAELAELATEELYRIGFPRRARELSAHDVPDSFLEDTSATVSTASGRVRLHTSRKPSVGDVLVLLSPEGAENATDRLPVTVKRSLRLRKSGILCTLLSHFESFSVNLLPFSCAGASPSLTALTGDAYSGGYVLCVAPGELRTLLAYMKDHALVGFSFAHLTEDARITFFRPQDQFFSISADFLRSLYRRKGYTLRLQESDAPDAPAPIDRSLIALSTCDYLDSALSEKGSESAFLSGLCCSAASAALIENPFKTALYTTLAPVLSQAVRGTPVGEQSLSVTLTYPTVRDALSAILGMYRVQTELGISCHECRLIPDEPQASPVMNVFALSELAPCPSYLTRIGETVYCLRIETDAHGIPVFSHLRESLSLLADLRRKRLLSSARVLIHESVEEGLQRMSTDFAFVPEEGLEDPSEELPLAVLLETSASLSLPAVGRTVAGERSIDEDLPTVRSPRDCLIPSDRPEIVLLTAGEDENAHMLSQILSTYGAHVQSFDCDGGIRPLSRAILGAHALILCRGAYPAKNEQLGFAIETLLRSGGSVIALYECEDATVLSLPNGLPDEIVHTLLINF